MLRQVAAYNFSCVRLLSAEIIDRNAFWQPSIVVTVPVGSVRVWTSHFIDNQISHVSLIAMHIQ